MHLLYLKKLQSSQHLRNHKMPRHCYSHKYFSTFVKFDISSSFSQQRESQSQRYEDGKKVYDSSMSKSRYVLVVAFIMPKIFQKHRYVFRLSFLITYQTLFAFIYFRTRHTFQYCDANNLQIYQ